MNKKWRKGLAMGLCAAAIVNSMNGSNINATVRGMDEEEIIENLENIASVEEVKMIDKSEVPENVIPLKFNNIEEAKKYLEFEEENQDYTISAETLYECYDVENNVVDLSGIDIENETVQENEQPLELLEMSSSANTKIATSSQLIDTGAFHIDVEYTEKQQKFKSIKNISSYYTGFTFGRSWEQMSTSKSITQNGKKMSVSVNGMTKHYILIDCGMTEIASCRSSYSATWTQSGSHGGSYF